MVEEEVGCLTATVNQKEQVFDFSKEPYHYVYKILEPKTGKFYFGVRSTFSHPNKDSYFGSGNWIKGLVKEKSLIIKELVGIFESRKLAMSAEMKIIAINHNNKNLMNIVGTMEKSRLIMLKRMKNSKIDFR